jgi:phage gp46-like protein
MPATSSTLGLADLALVWDETLGSADLVMIDSDLASDPGLETAVLLSLFTDARAANDDVPPSGDPTDRRGWWADQFSTVEGDKIGSRRWLLDRSKFTNETAIVLKEYDTEALQWMIDDGVASSVDITTALATVRGSPRINETIVINRPHGSPLTFRFAHVWDSIAA